MCKISELANTYSLYACRYILHNSTYPHLCILKKTTVLFTWSNKQPPSYIAYQHYEAHTISWQGNRSCPRLPSVVLRIRIPTVRPFSPCVRPFSPCVRRIPQEDSHCPHCQGSSCGHIAYTTLCPEDPHCPHTVWDPPVPLNWCTHPLSVSGGSWIPVGTLQAQGLGCLHQLSGIGGSRTVRILWTIGSGAQCAG